MSNFHHIIVTISSKFAVGSEGSKGVIFTNFILLYKTTNASFDHDDNEIFHSFQLFVNPFDVGTVRKPSHHKPTNIDESVNSG